MYSSYYNLIKYILGGDIVMDSSFLFQALGDSPSNVALINETLFDTKAMLYGASYTAQKHLAGMYKYTCSFADGKIERDNAYIFTVPYTYIELIDRIEYKQSAYYKKYIAYKDMIKDPDMFQESILVYIDGKLCSNFYVNFLEDKTMIKFNRYTATTKHISDGFTLSDIRNMQSSTITFVFMPMSVYRTGQFTTQELSFYNTIFTRSDKFLQSSNIDMSDKSMMVLYPKNQSASYNELYGYGFDYTTSDTSATSISYRGVDMLFFINSLDMAVNSYNTINVQFIHPKYLMDIIRVPNDGFFETSIMDLPIPTENMLIYRNDSSILTFDHTATIDMHYPNIYKISSDTPPIDGYVVYVFYNKATDGVGLVHGNELGLYYEFISDILDKYKNGNIPEYIKNYTPISTSYGISGYQSQNEDGLTYKINTLKELIHKNPFIYSLYLDKYVERYPKITRIVDEKFIDERLRETTERDLPNMTTPVDYREYDNDGNLVSPGRYIFSIRASSYNQSCAMFIDNKFVYTDEMYYTDDIYYIFIPYDMIHLGSKIEILLLHDLTMQIPLLLDSTIANEIKLTPNYRVHVDDLFITKSTGAVVSYTSNGTVQDNITATVTFEGVGVQLTDYVKLTDTTKVYHKITIPDNGLSAGSYFVVIDGTMYNFTITSDITATDMLNINVISEYITEDFGFYEKINPNERVTLPTDTIINDEYYRECIPYTKPDKVYIICGESLNNIPGLVLRTDKRNIFRSTIGSSPNHYIGEYFSTDRRNFMTFRDGRLMSRSRSAFTFKPNVNAGGPHIVASNVSVEDTTTVTVWHSSEKHDIVCEYHTAEVKRLRFYQKYLDDSNDITGRDGNIYDKIIEGSYDDNDVSELMDTITSYGHFVDLTNMLTKPISFNWYDIYLNGLRLTPDDVIIVSPYQLIILIDDDYPDIDSFIIVDIIGFIEDYLIPLSIINPDLQQITDELIEDFPEMVDNSENVPLDSDTLINIRSDVLIDPDEELGYTFEVISGIEG